MPAHGTRATYASTGCRCFACRLANTTYQADRRQAIRENRPLLGSKRSARAAWRLVKTLLREGVKKQEIAHGVGLQKPALQMHHRYITQRTYFRLVRFYRRVMGEE